jgi:hypothetical protein
VVCDCSLGNAPAGGHLWSQLPQAAQGIDPLTDAEQILSFADALLQDGDYFRKERGLGSGAAQ